jgi:hypothetical protein
MAHTHIHIHTHTYIHTHSYIPTYTHIPTYYTHLSSLARERVTTAAQPTAHHGTTVFLVHRIACAYMKLLQFEGWGIVLTYHHHTWTEKRVWRSSTDIVTCGFTTMTPEYIDNVEI